MTIDPASDARDRMSAHGPPRVGAADLVGEAVAGVVQRPLRSLLTSLGAAIGVCAVVVVLGLTATASAQVNERFDALRATEITARLAATDVTGSEGAPGGPATAQEPVAAFAVDAAERVRVLPGVEGAGRVGTVSLGESADVRSVLLPGATAGETFDVRTVEPAAWPVLDPTVVAGRVYDDGHAERGDRVAVLGVGAARRLGIQRLDAEPAVFIGGVGFSVIGIVEDLRRSPDLLGAVMIPPRSAERAFGIDPETDSTATILIETELGATQVIAERIPVALDPADPSAVRVDAPPDPRRLNATVTGDLDVLSLTLAAVSVLLGALGISNTMLVTVMERIHEIGLRRALGAGGHHIALQFLIEAAVLGGLGGLAGTAVGVVAVVGASILRDWTPVLAPGVVLLAPALGLLAGLVAGVAPAVRAARIQPADALRR
jgi:putative ABC transport system permease protein